MKFKIGDSVKVLNDGEVGQVKSIHVDENGVRYTITSREVDLQAKALVEGVKHLQEDELEAVEVEEKVEDLPEGEVNE